MTSQWLRTAPYPILNAIVTTLCSKNLLPLLWWTMARSKVMRRYYDAITVHNYNIETCQGIGKNMQALRYDTMHFFKNSWSSSGNFMAKSTVEYGRAQFYLRCHYDTTTQPRRWPIIHECLDRSGAIARICPV